MADDTARAIIQEADRRRADKAVLESHAQEIRDYIMPQASTIIGVERDGQKGGGKTLDNTAEMAHGMLTAFIISIICPEAIDFFTLKPKGSRPGDGPLVAFLQAASQTMLSAFRSGRRGFAGSAMETLGEAIGLGTGGLFIPRHPSKGTLFQSVPFRQILIGTDAQGAVCDLKRDFELSAKQAVREWQAKTPPKIAAAADRPSDAAKKFRFIHAVCPREDYSVGIGTKPYASIYVSAEDCAVITPGGFDEFPYAVPRWSKRADDDYGRGQGMVALADTKSLQRGMKMSFSAVEKKIEPALMVADDGMLSPVNTRRNAINFYRAGIYNQDPIKAIDTGVSPEVAESFLGEMRARIDAAFFRPLIQMIRKDRMTATEVLRVIEEGSNILGPYIGRLKAEFLEPLIQRTFWSMLRAGEFGPPPRQLIEREFEIEYLTPALKQQRVAIAQGLAQFLTIITPLVQLDQSVADNMDEDTVYRDTADTMGLPANWLRPVDMVAAMRKARSQVANEDRAHAQGMDMADAGAKLAGAAPALTQALASPTGALADAA